MRLASRASFFDISFLGEHALNIMSQSIDIGQQLLKARELKNLTLDDIEQSTRIPSSTITAMESNDYSAIPTPYARSFLVQYSEYLQVDASETIASLIPDENITNIGYLQNSQDTVGEKRGSSSKSRSKKGGGKGLGQLRSPSAHANGKKMAQPLAILGLVLLLIMAIGFFFRKDQSPQSSLANGSADTKELSSKQKQSALAEISSDSASADQGINTEDNARGIFDPISRSTNRLAPEQNVVSLRELAALSVNNMLGYNTANYDIAGRIADSELTPAVSEEADDNSASQEELAQRSSPPPKAMIIDEEEE